MARNANLFSHRFGIRDRRGEDVVPSDPSVEAGPIVVPVTGVRQAPRDERIVLLVVHRIAGFAGRAATNAPEPFGFRVAFFQIFVNSGN